MILNKIVRGFVDNIDARRYSDIGSETPNLKRSASPEINKANPIKR